MRVHCPIRRLGDLENFGPPPIREASFDKTVDLRAKENYIVKEIPPPSFYTDNSMIEEALKQIGN